MKEGNNELRVKIISRLESARNRRSAKLFAQIRIRTDLVHVRIVEPY